MPWTSQSVALVWTTGLGASGQDYSTILVDLERHRVADLLPERSAEELADWLTQHPTVSVISRDRSGLYAVGAQFGRAQFHTSRRSFSPCGEYVAIERALEERNSQRQLPAATPSASEQIHTPRPAPSKPTLQEARKQQRRQWRLSCYEQVVELHCEGHALKGQSVRRCRSRGKPFAGGFGPAIFQSASIQPENRRRYASLQITFNDDGPRVVTMPPSFFRRFEVKVTAANLAWWHSSCRGGGD
jgi:hypothetical protein